VPDVVAKFRVTNVRYGNTINSRQVEVEQPDGTIQKEWVHENQEVRSISMMAVYDPDPESENGQFWQATPQGQVELGIVRESVGNYFDLHGEYYVTFTSANPIPKEDANALS
jgi:hypothetical protein